MTQLLPGKPSPLGATYDGHGTNFAVHSDVAESIAVCVFEADGTEMQYWLGSRTGSIHHGYLSDLGPGTQYGIRVEGPWAPGDGLWCNPAKLQIDPSAAAISGDIEWDRAVYGFTVQDPDQPEPHDSAPYMPKSIVVDHTFDWGDDRPPDTAWHDTVIYETHVKGISRLHPDVPPELQGTYLGVASEPVIAHLTSLGVTAVELLPIQQFVHDHALVRHGLRNYWGYQPIGYFAPHHAYASSAAPAAAVVEVKQMVMELHAAGIEVIMDVVYNHTGESHHLGPNLSFRGIDNPAYYRLSDEDRRHYLDFSGVGNTINADHPAVLRLMADSLRMWVETYHVDGFRFDLATTLARSGLEFDAAGPFLHLMHQDPVLHRVKLIAEPWDVGPGGYRLGGFLPEWREWNDRYRDTVRDFWRGAPSTLADFASRLSGSSDVFASQRGRPPTASVNFVTSHDGYTLADLVSYEAKHNEANGQQNEDGHDDNRSWNTGAEGPTDHAAILELRARRRRSVLATLLLSQGVPMILGGDEIGRTQGGNNNAFAQDNEVSWYDWDSVDEPFLQFARRLVAIRRDHPVLRRRKWLTGAPLDGGRNADIAWFTPAGKHMSMSDWHVPNLTAMAVFLNGAALTTPDADGSTPRDDNFLMLFNGSAQNVTFTLPAELGPSAWRTVLDTVAPSTDEEPKASSTVDVAAFGLVVLCEGAA